MDAASVLKTELLSLEGASIEQKFLLMLMDRVEACEERLQNDASAGAPSHSFKVSTVPSKRGVFFNLTLWQVAPHQPGDKTALEYVGVGVLLPSLVCFSKSYSSVPVQLGGLLTAELSKLGLTSAELFLGLHSHYDVAWLDTDLRKPIEAEGLLIWSGAPMLTVEHIAAALETAWHTSLVSMSKGDHDHCAKLCSLCDLMSSALRPHRHTSQSCQWLSKSWQHAWSLLKYSVKYPVMRNLMNPSLQKPTHRKDKEITTLQRDTSCTQFKFFMLSAGEKQWTPLNIKNNCETPDHATYSSHVQVDTYMAYAVLGSTFNLEFMRGYTSSLGYHCHNSLMCEVDPNYDF